jgi:hypothetical protein
MNSKKICTTLMMTLLGFSSAVYAQDAKEEEKDEPTFSFSGSIDTYARTSFGTSNPISERFGPTTAFADLKGFSLGMANLIASYEGEKVGFVADLVFGPRGTDAVFNNAFGAGSASGQRIINQMYAYYKLSDAVKISLGQFNTYIGYEVISPTVNVNYSTSYLFSTGPFTHTGISADFDFGGGLTGKLNLMNGTDMLEFNPLNTYTLGAQIGKTSDAGGVWLNFLYGDQDGKLTKDNSAPLDFSLGSLFQVDLTGGYDLSEKFYLGFNASYQTAGEGQIHTVGGDIEKSGNDASSSFGVAIYPKVKLSDVFSLGLRGEYFSISKWHLGNINLDGDGNGSVTAFTLSGNYAIGNLMLIPEVRIDKTSEDSFVKLDGTDTDLMPSLLLAAVYKF